LVLALLYDAAVTRLAVFRLLAALGLATAAGCVVSPQPSPPDGPPTVAVIDGDGIGVGVSSSLTDFLSIQAEPGTVKPAGGTVVITDLDKTDAPSLAPVAADGSFSIAVKAAFGDTLRFQVKTDAGRSAPVDRTNGSSGLAAVLVTVPCFSVDPPLWAPLAGEGAARTLVLQNACSFPVTFAPPHLRRGKAGITFSPTAGFELAAGETTFVTLHGAAAGPEDEDVLYLETATPTGGRRALTITR
jgi:hypothetical protein